MRAVAAIGYLAVSMALGCLVVGFGVVLPAIEGGTELVDANLANAIAQGIALRLGLVLIAACAVVAIATPRWTHSRGATTLALVAVGLAGLDRLVLIPHLNRAWARADLVAGRPLDRIQEAVELTQWHHGVLVGLGLALIAVALIAQRERRPVQSGVPERAPAAAQPSPA